MPEAVHAQLRQDLVGYLVRPPLGHARPHGLGDAPHGVEGEIAGLDHGWQGEGLADGFTVRIHVVHERLRSAASIAIWGARRELLYRPTRSRFRALSLPLDEQWSRRKPAPPT